MEATKGQVSDLVSSVTRLADALHKGQSREFDPMRVGVLRVVAERGQVRPGEVAEELDALPSSVTRHVQVLADLGYLSVSADPSDRRAALMEATDAGREQLRQFGEVGTEVFASVIADWPTRDVTTLTGLLNRLITDWAKKGPEQQRAARNRRRFRWSDT